MNAKTPDFNSYMTQLSDALRSIKKEDIQLLSDLMLKTRDKGGFVYVFGNGDSATNAEHCAADLFKSNVSPAKRIRMHSLYENIPTLTAISNDSSYDMIFKDQLETLLGKDDLVIGISTSGNSPNVLKAIEYANSKSVTTVALSAFSGGKLLNLAKHNIIAKTDNVEIAEDIHWVIGHLIKTNLMRKAAGEI